MENAQYRSTVKKTIGFLEKERTNNAEDLKKSPNGLPSLFDGIKYFGPWSIGSFLFVKVTCLLTSMDLNPVRVYSIPIQGSTLLSLIASTYMSTVLLGLSIISKNYYDDEMRKKEALKIYDLLTEEELALKKEEYRKPNNAKEDEKLITLEEYKKRMLTRKKMILTLGQFKKQVLKHSRQGNLEAYLMSIGISMDEFRDNREFIEKNFHLEISRH